MKKVRTFLVKLSMTVLHTTGIIIFFITYPIFYWFYERDRDITVPPVESNLLELSATELARMIREKSVTSREVVEAFMHRIRQVNPIINAVVADRFDEALEEADFVDVLLDFKGELPPEYSVDKKPFLGVPFTTKEAIQIKDMPNTSGLLSRRHVKSTKNAVVIDRMIEAGAIPLAVTNISELCMWYESSNLLYGCSCNAYHSGCHVGGSSGGEACLQSAAGSPIGIGSDIGGSIRMPCFFNGIYGHKATPGVISNVGQYPDAKGEAVQFLATGPMCRFVDDLIPMLKVMASPNTADLQLDLPVNFESLKVYYMISDGGAHLVSPIDPAISSSVLRAASLCQSLGADVTEIHVPAMQKSFIYWSAKMTASGNDDFCSFMGDGTPVNPFVELFYFLCGRKRHTLPAILLGIVEKFSLINKEMCIKCDTLKEELTALLGNNGILLYPGHPISATYHSQPLLMPFNFSYTGIFNVLGFPVTACPMGMSCSKMPIGIQIISTPYNDRYCLALAAELSRKLGGWIPPYKAC